MDFVCINKHISLYALITLCAAFNHSSVNPPTELLNYPLKNSPSLSLSLSHTHTHTHTHTHKICGFQEVKNENIFLLVMTQGSH